MTLVTYDPSLTMREARARYFAANHFGDDGGYNDAWVQIKLGPLPVSFPNTKGRVAAVRYHDLHHVLTGYDTDNVGEFEISAWEIAAGCKQFVAAWGLNLGGIAGGLFRAPRRTLRAFVRGRHSQTFYGLNLDELLDLSVADARKRMGLDAADAHGTTLFDLLLLTLSAAVGLAIGLVFLCLGLLATPALLLAQAARRITVR